MAALLYISNIRALDLPDNYDRAYCLLSDECKEKTDQYKNIENKKRSLISQLLLGKALTDRKKDPLVTIFEYGKYNKPYLKNETDFFFNISHSYDYVILAVSDKEIGCDIEKIRKYDLKIAKRFFTKNEYENIIGISDEEERRRMFFRYWTLKESFIKQNGRGLSQPLNSFEITIDEDEKISVRTENGDSDLYLTQFELIPGYLIAVCSYVDEIDVIDTDLNDLFEGEKVL